MTKEPSTPDTPQQDWTPEEWGAALAEHLDGEWTWSADTWLHRTIEVTLRGPGTEYITVSTHDNWSAEPFTHLAVTAQFGDLWDFIPHGMDKFRGVNIAKSKPVTRIAREIERRFLAGYRETLAVAFERKADHDERERQINDRLDEFEAILGRRRRADRELEFGDWPLCGSIKVVDKTIEITACVPRSTALPVAKIIATLLSVEKGTEQ